MFSKTSIQVVAAGLVLAANSYTLTGIAALADTETLHMSAAMEQVSKPATTLHAEVDSLFSTKKELLNRSITVEFVTTQKESISTHTISLAEMPDVLQAVSTKRGVAIEVDQSVLLTYIDSWIQNETFFQKPSVGLVDQHDEWNSSTSGTPSGGYTVDVSVFAASITLAIEREHPRIRMQLTEHNPEVALIDDYGRMHTLSHLSTGRSNYEGSIPGRVANVEHALNRYLNGIVVAAGETFSFNRYFADSTGWSPAYVIVNGGELALESGGGICQSSTTLFRAVALAGLPITEQKNHSLYVSYYEEYGVGMDATIYPGKQDFRFVNDTDGPLVILARNEGPDAYVDIYGVDDGRTAQLDGPYFKTDNEELHRNDIAWERTVTMANGEVRNDHFVSRYTAIPKDLALKYEGTNGMKVLTTHTTTVD